jgi:hypothetical protein
VFACGVLRALVPHLRCAALVGSFGPPAPPALSLSLSRPPHQVVVTFNADVADGMPWRFFPTQRQARTPCARRVALPHHLPLPNACLLLRCCCALCICAHRKQVVVRPGESTLAFYTAHNTSDEPITGTRMHGTMAAAAARACTADGWMLARYMRLS